MNNEPTPSLTCHLCSRPAATKRINDEGEAWYTCPLHDATIDGTGTMKIEWTDSAIKALIKSESDKAVEAFAAEILDLATEIRLPGEARWTAVIYPEDIDQALIERTKQ